MGLSVPCRDPFKAVRSMRVRVPSPLFLFSPNFLFSCLYMSTYFYTNKTTDCVEDLLMPELAKQTNHRPVTLNPSAAKAPQLLLQACSRKTHVLSLLVACGHPITPAPWGGFLCNGDPLQTWIPCLPPNHSGRKVPAGFHLKGWKLPSGPTGLITPRH